MATQFDFLIFGAGHLGQRVLKLLTQSRAETGRDYKVAALTNSDKRHSALQLLGAKVFTQNDLSLSGQHSNSTIKPKLKSDGILFCVPPSGAEDYLERVKDALELWSGKRPFVFTSSTAVYLEDQGGEVTETSPIYSSLSPSPSFSQSNDTAVGKRAEKLVAVENLVLARGGTVLRLAGLYSLERGPHVHYQKKKNEIGVVSSRWLNLIHYDDAAELGFRLLISELPAVSNSTYLGVDDRPMLIQDFLSAIFPEDSIADMDSVDHGDSLKPQGSDPIQVQGLNQKKTIGMASGKRCCNLITRQKLNWLPRWPAFHSWLQSSEGMEYLSKR